jgi:hypothetical protein
VKISHKAELHEIWYTVGGLGGLNDDASIEKALSCILEYSVKIINAKI